MPVNILPASRRTLKIASVLLLALMISACEKVQKPASDSTPPTLTWHVANLTTDVSTEIAGNGALAAKVNDELRVTLKANDPQGVAYIQFGGGYATSCRAGGAASSAAGSYNEESQSLSPDAENKVLTSIFLIRNFTPATTCPGRSTFMSTTVALNGSASNYYSGVTQGVLNITVTP